MIRAALCALAICLAPTSAPAQDDPATVARRAANALAQAQLQLAEAESARDRVAALTETVRAYEEGLLALRGGLRRAAIREDAIRRRFEAESARLSQLLGVLTTIEAAPAPLLLLHPEGPVDTARAGMVLAEITPALRREAETLRSELEEIAILRSLQESAAEALQQGAEGVTDARTRLSKAVSDRTDLPRRYLDDPAALQRIIGATETLEGFASALAAQDPVAGSPALPDFEDARGILRLPVTGRILRSFGAPDAAGIVRPGMVVATPSRAVVTTPWPATIRYRGPLLDYGNVVLLEPGGGYLLVLAGLGTLYGEVGEVLPRGAPVGLMGGAAPDTEALLAQDREGSGGQLSETLYMELRRGTEPVDPEPWFAADER
jgi:septal ring factor EnvC (AmiA/AmiB activator)